MPLLIVDGPEAAGKTTLITEIAKLIPEYTETKPTIRTRQWGPVSDWSDYIHPLHLDLMSASQGAYILWDRSWAAEVVYNALLQRGRIIDPESLSALLSVPLKRRNMRLIVLSSPDVLASRRAERVKNGEKPDLPVDPEEEINAFRDYGRKTGWVIMQSPSPQAVCAAWLGSH